jgi:hypothetical protein
MLRYASLRFVTLRYASLRFVTLRYASLRFVTLRFTTLILPELVADVFEHHNRIPRACRDILRHNSLVHPHRLRKSHTYHTIWVVRVNLPKRAVGNRLVLRVMFVMQEELDHLPQSIILPLQFNIKAILNRAYRRYNMILAAFDIADELRTLVNHNLRCFVDDFRVRKDTNRLHHEIETVLFRLALRVQERPVLPLRLHFVASQGGETFLHDLGFLDAPRFVDLRSIHRHTVRAGANHIEHAVFASCPDIQVTRHRELLAFAVF